MTTLVTLIGRVPSGLKFTVKAGEYCRNHHLRQSENTRWRLRDCRYRGAGWGYFAWERDCLECKSQWDKNRSRTAAFVGGAR